MAYGGSKPALLRASASERCCGSRFGFFVDFIRFLFLDLLKMVGTNKNIIYINISRMVV